jgi:16S rRNA (uracil1498-N3)-methyltransferase
MKVHAFIVNEEIGKKLAKASAGHSLFVDDESLVKQWSLVLRFVPGEQVLLYFNEGMEALCEFVRVTKQDAELVIGEVRKNTAASALAGKEVRAYVSLIKGDRFDMVIQKVAELGVHTLVPVISERSIKRSLNMERSYEIAREAAEQSMCARVMVITEPMTVSEAIDDAQKACDAGVVLAHIPEGTKEMPNIASVWKKGKGARGFFVGPEGGFSDEEVSTFMSAGVEFVTLGSTVLRAETAAIVSAFAAIGND